MSTFTFTKATKRRAKLRMAIIGPAGSGKTYTALTLARHLGERVAVIDTERGSASKYADLFGFDVLELDQFSPQTYVQAVEAAGQSGYDVLVVDSLSHAWVGPGGALEMVDAVAARGKSGNSFGAWREVTPHHNALVNALLQAPCHLIGTMRSKTDYVQEKDDRGRTVIRKVGLAPVQRDGLEYEFDVVGDMDQEHTLVVTKTRCPALSGQVIRLPGEALARTLCEWLGRGSDAPTEATPAPAANGKPPADPAAPIGEDGLARLREHCEKCGWEMEGENGWLAWLGWHPSRPFTEITRGQANGVWTAANKLAAAAKQRQAPASAQAPAPPPADSGECITDEQRDELTRELHRTGKPVSAVWRRLRVNVEGDGDLAALTVSQWRDVMASLSKLPDAAAAGGAA